MKADERVEMYRESVDMERKTIRRLEQVLMLRRKALERLEMQLSRALEEANKCAW